MGKFFDFFCNFSLLVAELREFTEAIQRIDEDLREAKEEGKAYEKEMLSLLRDIHGALK